MRKEYRHKSDIRASDSITARRTRARQEYLTTSQINLSRDKKHEKTIQISLFLDP